MSGIVTWGLNRLKEGTTWAGIVTMIGSAGWALSPELGAAIQTAGIAVAGLILAVWKENQADDT